MINPSIFESITCENVNSILSKYTEEELLEVYPKLNFADKIWVEIFIKRFRESSTESIVNSIMSSNSKKTQLNLLNSINSLPPRPFIKWVISNHHSHLAVSLINLIIKYRNAYEDTYELDYIPKLVKLLLIE